MNKSVAFKMLMILTFFCTTCLGCGKEAITGNSFFIPKGYEQILKAKGLSEIAAMPYFKSPFITIAKNNNEDQFAVIIRDTGETEVVKLPVKIEGILKILELKGFKITASNIYFKNLHLFEINKRLVWNYEEDAKIYLDLESKEIDPFKN